MPRRAPRDARLDARAGGGRRDAAGAGTESKLKDLAKEISAKYPERSVKVLAIDYSSGFDKAKRLAVEKALTGMEIGILANNVGMSYPFTKRVDRAETTSLSTTLPRRASLCI